MYTDIQNSTLMEPEKKARQSYYADIFWSLLNIVFLGTWLYQINSEGKVTIFDEQYMDNGFCNLPSVDGKVNGSDSPTQIACFGFDWSMAALVIYLALIIWKVPISWGSSGYLVVHGLAHGLIYMGKVDTSIDITTGGLVIIFVILAMGAYGVYDTMKNVGIDEKLALIVSILVDIFFTGLFAVYLKKGVYVLTYVNIVINLCVNMPRALLVPPTKVVIRLKAFLGPYFYQYIFLITLMNVVIWVEPLFCSKWFASIGGHIWFDVSLFAVMFLGILYAKLNNGRNRGIGASNFW